MNGVSLSDVAAFFSHIFPRNVFFSRLEKHSFHDFLSSLLNGCPCCCTQPLTFASPPTQWKHPQKLSKFPNKTFPTTEMIFPFDVPFVPKPKSIL